MTAAHPSNTILMRIVAAALRMPFPPLHWKREGAVKIKSVCCSQIVLEHQQVVSEIKVQLPWRIVWQRPSSHMVDS